MFTNGNFDHQSGIIGLVSASGDPTGPWQPHLVYQSIPVPEPDAVWNVGTADPSALILSNGSLLIAYRTNPSQGSDHEHIGLLYADHWSKPARLLTTEAS